MFAKNILYSIILVGCFINFSVAFAQSDTPQTPVINVTNSLMLDDALRLAEEGAPQIALARAEVAAAEGRALQAGLRPNPEARLEIENFSGQRNYAGFDEAETTLAISQRLELGGKRSSRRDAAGAAVESARLRLEIARAETARQVRTAFAETLAARDRLSLARENRERAKELARISAELVDAGREPPLRSLRAQSALSEAEAVFESASSEFEASGRVLASVWGGRGVADIRETTGERVADLTDFDAESSLDVRHARAELRAAELGVRREVAAGRPDVTAELGVRRFEDSGSQAAIFGLSIPLPFSDRNQGNAAAARADVLAAETKLSRARNDSERAMLTAQRSQRAAGNRLTTLESAVAKTADALDLARRGYEAGKFTLLEVLDAQTAHSSSQSNLIEARLQSALASAALLRATAQ